MTKEKRTEEGVGREEQKSEQKRTKKNGKNVEKK